MWKLNSELQIGFFPDTNATIILVLVTQETMENRISFQHHVSASLVTSVLVLGWVGNQVIPGICHILTCLSLMQVMCCFSPCRPEAMHMQKRLRGFREIRYRTLCGNEWRLWCSSEQTPCLSGSRALVFVDTGTSQSSPHCHYMDAKTILCRLKNELHQIWSLKQCFTYQNFYPYKPYLGPEGTVRCFHLKRLGREWWHRKQSLQKHNLLKKVIQDLVFWFKNHLDCPYYQQNVV